jgi:hypothetical protein
MHKQVSGRVRTSSNILVQNEGFSILKVKTPGECSIRMRRSAASDPSLIASKKEFTKKRSGSKVYRSSCSGCINKINS